MGGARARPGGPWGTCGTVGRPWGDRGRDSGDRGGTASESRATVGGPRARLGGPWGTVEGPWGVRHQLLVLSTALLPHSTDPAAWSLSFGSKRAEGACKVLASTTGACNARSMGRTGGICPDCQQAARKRWRARARRLPALESAPRACCGAQGLRQGLLVLWTSMSLHQRKKRSSSSNGRWPWRLGGYFIAQVYDCPRVS